MGIQETLVTYVGGGTNEKSAADTFAENFVAAFEKQADPLGHTPNNEHETITGRNGVDPGEVPEERKNEIENKAQTHGRSEHESFTSSVEQSNVEDNHSVLDELFGGMGDMRRTDKATIGELFEHGKPGQYTTRSRTLTEQVRGLK